MAHDVPNNAKQGISTQEYVDFLRSRVDLHDFDSMMEGASALAELALSKQELATWLNRCLRLETSVTNETITTHSGDGFHVRYCLWLPDRPMETVLHDHYFDFVTCCCVGPGYETEVYRRDPKRYEPCAGGRETLLLAGTYGVPEGRLMYWVAGEDAHLVRPPAAVSVTVNLVVDRPDRPPVTRFIDPARQVVRSVHTNDRRIFSAEAMIDLYARFAGSGAFEDLVRIVECRSYHGLSRVKALQCLRQTASPADFEHVLNRVLDDPDDYLGTFARLHARNPALLAH